MKHVNTIVRRVIITKNLRLWRALKRRAFPGFDEEEAPYIHLRKREGGKGRGGVDFSPFRATFALFGTPPVATRSHERA